MTFGVIFMGSGPPKPFGDSVLPPDGPTVWTTGPGTEGNFATSTDGPQCWDGRTHANRQLDQVVGRSEMNCSGPVTLQSMSAQLKRCTWWFFGCLGTSGVQHLDSATKVGPGYWELPEYGFYQSSPLQPGRYLVITRHTVTWPGGSNAGSSSSDWVIID